MTDVECGNTCNVSGDCSYCGPTPTPIPTAEPTAVPTATPTAEPTSTPEPPTPTPSDVTYTIYQSCSTSAQVYAIAGTFTYGFATMANYNDCCYLIGSGFDVTFAVMQNAIFTDSIYESVCPECA